MKPPQATPLRAAGRAPAARSWVDELYTQVGRFQGDGEGDLSRRDAESRIWLLLNVRLRRLVLAHCRRSGWLEPEDLEDLVSEKALELMNRLRSGQWDPTAYGAGETVNFLGTVARNALTDHRRSRGREANHMKRVQEAQGGAAIKPALELLPGSRLEGTRYAEALAGCVEKLAPRSRLVWLGRVFHELSSRELAVLPAVRTTPGNVDVILARSRRGIKTCMEKKGFNSAHLPPGSYAEIWYRFVSSPEEAP